MPSRRRQDSSTSATGTAAYTITSQRSHADVLACGRRLYGHAGGDDQRHDCGRDHLPHDQWNDANDFLCGLLRSDFSERLGDAERNRDGDWLWHQRHGHSGLRDPESGAATPTFFSCCRHRMRPRRRLRSATRLQARPFTTRPTGRPRPRGPRFTRFRLMWVRAKPSRRWQLRLDYRQQRRAGSAKLTPITTSAATPIFSLLAGTLYQRAKSVVISDTTAGATIYYTTNGTTPTTSSTVYSGPVAVSVTETIQAIATVAGFEHQRHRIGGLHHQSTGERADDYSGSGHVYDSADGDDHQHHLRRDHLLHHQWHHANDLIDGVCRSIHGKRY